jgi:hypothetical protein
MELPKKLTMQEIPCCHPKPNKTKNDNTARHHIVLLFALNGVNVVPKKNDIIKRKKGEETYLQGPHLGLFVPFPCS